jgi:membrane fusion protein, multidrug efflux system
MSLVEERTRPAAERVAPVKRELELDRPDHSATIEPQRPRRRQVLIVSVVLALAIAAAGGGVVWWLDARNWVSTDDAFIQMHMVQVSPQAAGRTAHVLVEDNEEVNADQPLVEIDPADFKAKLDQALAAQQNAAGQLAQARAQLAVSRPISMRRRR